MTRWARSSRSALGSPTLKSPWRPWRLGGSLSLSFGASNRASRATRRGTGSPQAKVAGLAGVQATDRLKGIAAVFFADRLKTGVETLLADASRARVLPQV